MSPTVVDASTSDPRVLALLDALTEELAGEGYTAEQTFGFSVDQLTAAGVHLVAAEDGGRLVGLGGLELQPDGYAELKRFYVVPDRRGSDAAALVLAALLDHARARGVHTVRLETGDRQQRAMAFYRRAGFRGVPRFGPYVDSATSVCLALPLGEPPAR